jgi:hypothetical protein
MQSSRHNHRADACLDGPLWPGPVVNNTLPSVRQALLGKLRDEARGLCFQGRGQHLSCAFTRDLGERVDE